MGITKHGHSTRTVTSRTYSIWQNMKQRCTNPNRDYYADYGGRGIFICNRWMHSFENFLEDMGTSPEGRSIDRIDNDDGYYKGNCRWATAKDQHRNKRSNKLTYEKVAEIKILLNEDNLTHQIIADMYEVDRSTVGYIKNGKTWG